MSPGYGTPEASTLPVWPFWADAARELNTCANALDRHVEHGRGEQAALIYDSPLAGTTRTYTHRELLDETSRFAGVLRGLGVRKGDRIVDYKSMVDTALDLANHTTPACVILQRDQAPCELKAGRDVSWTDAMADADPVDPVPVAATDPLYVRYTSGTPGKPKGIVRDNGGHAVALLWTMRHIYDTEPGDVYWAASDVGWVVGHSYIVYGPLLLGATTVLYEGKPVGTPDAGAFWRVVVEHVVKALFSAPTAMRAIKKEDPDATHLAR